MDLLQQDKKKDASNALIKNLDGASMLKLDNIEFNIMCYQLP